MQNHNHPSNSTTDGRCGPTNWANCPACRTLKNNVATKFIKKAAGRAGVDWSIVVDTLERANLAMMDTVAPTMDLHVLNACSFCCQISITACHLIVLPFDHHFSHTLLARYMSVSIVHGLQRKSPIVINSCVSVAFALNSFNVYVKLFQLL